MTFAVLRIYTGPYAITAHSSTEIRLERFDGYWRGAPMLPGVVITRVPDVQARILAVQNGEADIALYPPTEVKRTIVVSSPKVLGEHMSVLLCRQEVASRSPAHTPNLDVRFDGPSTFR